MDILNCFINNKARNGVMVFILLFFPILLCGSDILLEDNGKTIAEIDKEWEQYNALMKQYSIVSKGDLQTRFNFMVTEWKTHKRPLSIRVKSNPTPHEWFILHMDGELSKMAFTILPFVVTNCIKEPSEEAHHRLWKKVMRIKYVKPGDNPWEGESEEFLYSGGRELARARTLLLLKEFELAEKERRFNDHFRLRKAVWSLGAMAYETIVDEVKKGNGYARHFTWLIYSYENIRDDNVTITEWWETNKDRYTLPPQSPDFKGDYGLDKWKRLGR